MEFKRVAVATDRPWRGKFHPCAFVTLSADLLNVGALVSLPLVADGGCPRAGPIEPGRFARGRMANYIAINFKTDFTQMHWAVVLDTEWHAVAHRIAGLQISTQLETAMFMEAAVPGLGVETFGGKDGLLDGIGSVLLAHRNLFLPAPRTPEKPLPQRERSTGRRSLKTSGAMRE